ncbi:response regulator transcription factor [Ruegeria faecimaris]|uniref:response regulator transcription factor n=1 Tax=Ruegeria faecimaris TaxID=686389 RepID=UPI0023314226|nr:response regulator transcription factor [Ruegeria faecimaris]
MNILVVDDDPRLREVVRLGLERAGYSVSTAANGQEAVISTFRDEPDLIVLDVGLPELDGFAVCQKIRTRSDVPILFLTARDDEVDRILGLELGADDYVTKPFSPRELVTRVKVILRRTNRIVAAPGNLRHGPLTLDRTARLCACHDTEIALTGTEFQIMVMLMETPGRLVPRTALIAEIWGARSQVSDRTLDSHLRNLRNKFAQVGLSDSVETVHGQGIRMRRLG